MGFFDYFKRKPSPAQRERRFKAAQVERLTSSWLTQTESINMELKEGSTRLRSRARDLSKNNEYGKKLCMMTRNNIVGQNGFRLQSRFESGDRAFQTEVRRAVENSFLAWSAQGCEITGKQTFVDVCQLLIGAMPSDGEFLVREVYGDDANNPFGYALQLINIDRLDTEYNRPKSSGRNEIVMGVELSQYGQPLYYHILTAHPNQHAHERKRQRIPVKDIIHAFVLDEAEQVRGVPWMAPSILSLHHLSAFEESAMMAARHGADTLGFLTKPIAGGAPLDGAESDDTEEAIELSAPGTYDALPDGYDIKQFQSEYPAAMTPAFIKNFLRRIASGAGVSYNGFANDLEGVNFSSMRAGILEERYQWMTLQNWFAGAFLQRVYAGWLKAALLKGQIVTSSGQVLPGSMLDVLLAHQWQGRRWQWVDPLKDVQAARDSIKMGTASPQMIADQQGVDVWQVLEDIKEFESAAAGLTTVDITSAAAKQVNNVDGKVEPEND